MKYKNDVLSEANKKFLFWSGYLQDMHVKILVPLIVLR